MNSYDLRRHAYDAMADAFKWMDDSPALAKLRLRDAEILEYLAVEADRESYRYEWLKAPYVLPVSRISSTKFWEN